METPGDFDEDAVPGTWMEIVRFAREFANRLRAEPHLFPSSTVSADDVDGAIVRYLNTRETAVVALARVQQAKDALEKIFVDFYESMVNRPPTEAPGQINDLEVVHQARGEVSLSWSHPRAGGEVAVYQVERRTREGEWQYAGYSLYTELTLHGQDRGVELEYRLIPKNEVGDGPASNVVRALC